MAYHIKLSDAAVTGAVRRLAVNQLDTALAEIGDTDLELDERVHQTRKRCKKVRGLIRLVRPAFPDYARENAALRDAARRLSALRDASAMVEIMDALVEGDTSGLSRARQRDMIDLMMARREAVDEDAAEAALDAFRTDIEKTVRRARRWRLEADGWAAIAGGLEKTHKRMRKAMQAAFDDPSRETIHEWRKRVKYHGYHARLLREIWPVPMAAYIEEVGRLSDCIGDYRDFSLLRLELDEIGGEVAEQAIALAEARQREMHPQIVALGRRLAAGKSSRLIRRWGEWWQVWRVGESGETLTLAA